MLKAYTFIMIRWLIVIFLALLLINGLHGWLQRIGLGRLPGDFRFRLFGREFFLPIASKLKSVIGGRSREQEMIIEGLIAIAQGENPRNIEAKLAGFLH